MSLYWSGAGVELHHGDSRELMPGLGTFDAIVTDPPYGETSLAWDRWPDGWPSIAAGSARSMWVFGSLRMFLERSAEFDRWKLSQDVVWEKHNGSSLAADRFSRVHEHAVHWYQGAWSDVHHETPTTPDSTPRTLRRKAIPAQWQGATGPSAYESIDGGPRLMRSVIYARSMHGRATHPTEKPVGILTPLIEYVTARGGAVLDPFAGSGSTLDAARQAGRRAVGIEANEAYCEAAARRLDQGVLEFEATP